LTEIANRYWRQDWCDESLASWDFSEGEEEHEQEDPVKKEEQEPDDDGEEFPVKEQKADEEEEEGQAVTTFFCHETNAGANMDNPVDNHGISHGIWQEGFDHDDNEHQRKKKKRRKRTRSSRRKKKQRARAQVLARETLIRHICCILLAIIVRASIMAYPE
jgi:hypothetical protein